jgi:hypothetical protein
MLILLKQFIVLLKKEFLCILMIHLAHILNLIVPILITFCA